MKQKTLLFTTLLILCSINEVDANYAHSDSSLTLLAKKVAVLEQSVLDQNKKILELKAPKVISTTTFAVERRSSKQVVKKVNYIIKP